MDARLNCARTLLEEAREELLDSATSGNINREHHFEAAVVVFQDVEHLWKAQRILEGLYGEEEGEVS
jgi:acyl transferase domain-containing protein